MTSYFFPLKLFHILNLQAITIQNCKMLILRDQYKCNTKHTTIFTIVELKSFYWFLSKNITCIIVLPTNNLSHQQLWNFCTFRVIGLYLFGSMRFILYSLRAFTSVVVENLTFSTQNNYFIYFNISLNNIQYISFLTLTHYLLK